ncbi:MAG TPA: mercuric reductase [bacterium]
MPTEKYDAVIIGSGQAGGPLATTLANAGWNSVLIEKEHVGGTCVNEGCTPTKTMVASARVAYLAKRAADYGVHAGPVSVDMKKVRQRKRDIVNSFRNGNQKRIESTKNLELIFGEARFTAAKTIAVNLNGGGIRQVSADKIFINVGTRPVNPPVPGLDQVPTLNSTSIMELDTLPKHLLVMGGGYIGLEFGQMFRRFGSEITVVQRGKQLLAREDDDVAAEVAKILREDGIEILLETEALAVSKNSNGEVDLRVRNADGERNLAGSHLLAAVGRIPNADRLNLESAGVKLDKRGFIQVNDRLETSAPDVYALGDVKGGPMFTHISYDDFRIIRSNLLEKESATINGRLVPYTVFIDPQLGRVGLTETEAREKGLNVQVAKMPMNFVARALEMDESRGFMKAIVDADTKLILGGAIFGIEGGEMMAALQMAMLGKLPYTVLRDAVFAHPTLAEAFNNLFTNLEN